LPSRVPNSRTWLWISIPRSCEITLPIQWHVYLEFSK
jgi:hypothetical protein